MSALLVAVLLSLVSAVAYAFAAVTQARLATRRGPRWPARLLWLPFVGLVLLTVPVSANTAVFLWLGFVPLTILGLVPLVMVGPPNFLSSTT